MEWQEIPGVDWAFGLKVYNNTPALNNWKSQSWEQTLHYIRANRDKIDVFLSYLYPRQIDAQSIQEIRKLGIPCVNFYCDHIREFTKLPNEFKVFDLAWVPEFEAIPMYRAAQINYLNLPMPMWVEKQFRNTKLPDEFPAISFIGSKDSLRENLLGEAIALGLPISVRGSGWIIGDKPGQVSETSWVKKIVNQYRFIVEHGLSDFLMKIRQQSGSLQPTAVRPENIFPAINFEEYISITRNSKVTLGINRVPTFKKPLSDPLVYSRLRDI